MPADQHATIASRLLALRQEHRELDRTITALTASHAANELQLKRMKKQKLALKDAIARLESDLIPDLDA